MGKFLCYFLKWTPEMYPRAPPRFQISKHATGSCTGQIMSSRDFDDVSREPGVEEDEEVYDDWSDCQSNGGGCCGCCCRERHASSRTDCVHDLDLHGIARLAASSNTATSPPLRRSVSALSNSATFDDLEWCRTPVSRSRYSLKAKYLANGAFDPLHVWF